MINYEEALSIITNKLSIVSHTRDIPLLDSVKHVCAKNVYAMTSLPTHPIALKDGFAFLDDESYEVSTGDILKYGTLAVVPYEESISNPPYMYNIKKAGEDIQKNELLISSGELITAYGITSLASQGIKTIKVFKKPKISILSIGDNLCPVQKEIKKGEVYNSNALSLGARILEVGAKVSKVWQVKNDKEAIKEHLDELKKHSDFIITTGAMSRYDAMSQVIYEDEFNILFHKVQIAPASPTAFSVYKETPILHLTGLPLSSLLGFELLGVPAIKIIKNESIGKIKSLHAKNEKEFTCKENCTSAIPGFFDGESFKSAPTFKAGMLNVLSKCNGYALIKDKTIIKDGDLIEFFSF
ncbi:molybdopterin molybdotransferase MoeA [Sulfurospirillum sp.]|nr:molybdopterin molybdotransferase MoeA [Sulfurospirillum sp.]